MPEITKKKPETVTESIPEENGKPAAEPKSKPKAAAEKKPEAKPANQNGQKREVKFSEVTAKVRKGNNALKLPEVKKILGWEDEDEYVEKVLKEKPNANPEKISLGKKFLLKDANGKKVNCHNNIGNRHLTEAWMRSLAYDHLNKRFKLNGESVIIGETGRVLSAQHRLGGYVYACQIWEKDERWKKLWPEMPVMETVMVTGISEDYETIRTLDNVKPRTLADVIYTSELFRSLKDDAEKMDCCRTMDAATKFLWQRMGAKSEWNPYPTHGAAMDFIDRHRKNFLACVKEVHELCCEYQWAANAIGLSDGIAAGLMFLMASSKSDPKAYRKANPPTEKKLDFSRMEQAVNFWKLIYSNNAAVSAIKDTLLVLQQTPSPEGGSRAEMLTVVAKAWDAFLKKGTISLGNVEIEESDYATSNSGKTYLISVPGVGGVDLGSKSEPEEEEELTPDQIAENAETGGEDE